VWGANGCRVSQGRFRVVGCGAFRLGFDGGLGGEAENANVPASPPHHKAPRRAAHPHANSPQVVGNTALALRTFVIEAAAPQTVRDVVVPISEPVTIVELRESMCCWPIGDPAQPDFRFCGAKKLPGEGPYCACHAGIAYQTQHKGGASRGRRGGLRRLFRATNIRLERQ
jgi:GcrA cell cycle regulator